MSRIPEEMPYGSWKSPITADRIVGGSVGLSQPIFDGGNVYWIELRPTQGGRNVVVRRDSAGICEDVIPPPFNARNRVHEYGGGDYTVAEGTVYFSNFADQRLYRQRAGEQPEAITAAGALRYAEPIFDTRRRRVICVREDHSNLGSEAVNCLVSINPENGPEEHKVLAAGNDFYSSAKLSPDGNQLAWLTWNHPNMPWDGSELCVADLSEDGEVVARRRVAGGRAESIFQPEWTPDGILYFASDRNGWWNLERLTHDGQIEPVHETKKELGMPQWVFGMSSYVFVTSSQIICSHVEQGVSRLEMLDLSTSELKEIDCPFTDIQYLHVSNGKAVF